MDRCLPKRALLLCAAGEGTNEQLLHVATCNSCQRRYLRFVRDLETIEQVLRETPPAITVTPPFLHYNRWLPVTAALAVIIVLVWGWRVQQVSEPLPSVDQAAKQEAIVRFLQDEVSPAVFLVTPQREFIAPAPVSDARYLEAALTDGWPCEWQSAAFASTCEFYPLSLTFVKR